MAASPDISAVRKALEKHFKEATELFPDFTTIKQIPVIPSRSTVINAVLGVGGFPRGRVTEVYGEESSGKTTFAIDTCASLQTLDKNGTALFLDFEHAFDATYAHNIGLDLDPTRFIFAQPETFEQGARITDEFVERDLVDMIVIDSAAAMTPKDELEGEADGTSRIGLQAQLMSKFMARMTKKIGRGRKPALVILNQTRARIDVNNARNNDLNASAAGKALRFYASIRLELTIAKQEGDTQRGSKFMDRLYTQNRVRVSCVKNKVAPPWSRAQLILEYGKGINNLASVAELAEASLGIMSGAGFFKYTGDTPGTTFSCRGRESFLELLTTTPALLKEIEHKVLMNMRLKQAEGLGIKSINMGDQAKEIEQETLVLDDPTAKVTGMLARGEGLPAEVLD